MTKARLQEDRSDVKSLQEEKLPEDFLKARRDSQSWKQFALSAQFL